jgi:hypothetical protein
MAPNLLDLTLFSLKTPLFNRLDKTLAHGGGLIQMAHANLVLRMAGQRGRWQHRTKVGECQPEFPPLPLAREVDALAERSG